MLELGPIRVIPMNPFRALFLSLSKMPPIMMLFVILGVAVVVTMYVMGIVNESQERLAKDQQQQQQQQQQQRAAVQTGPTKTVVVARTYIPAGSKIQEIQIKESTVEELAAWDDADSGVAMVIGRSAKRAIPVGAQIRETDLESP